GEQPDKDQKESALQAASTVGKVATAMLAGISLKAGIPSVAEVSLDMSKAFTKAERIDEKERYANTPRSFYFGSFQALSQAFADFRQQNPGRRLVVFVDDLDRCLPEGALQVLESMKLFFDFDGFVFVVGLDEQVVERLVQARFRNTYTHDSEAGD